MTKAVVLVSGGMDSLTALAMAVNHSREIYPLWIGYGQNNFVEMKYAEKQVALYKAMADSTVHDLRIVDVCNLFDDYSAITTEGKSSWGEDDVFYVPGRNLIMASIAASYAESVGATEIHVGFVGKTLNGDQAEAVPDVSSSFVAALNSVLWGTGVEATIAAPFTELNKAEVLERAVELGAPVGWSFTCVSPLQMESEFRACGVCPACTERAAAFALNGLLDRWSISL